MFVQFILKIFSIPESKLINITISFNIVFQATNWFGQTLNDGRRRTTDTDIQSGSCESNKPPTCPQWRTDERLWLTFGFVSAQIHYFSEEASTYWQDTPCSGSVKWSQWTEQVWSLFHVLMQ